MLLWSLRIVMGIYRIFFVVFVLEVMVVYFCSDGEYGCKSYFKFSFNFDFMLKLLVCLMGEEGVFILNG